MDGAKKLAYLLEGCGAKYTRTDATEGTLFTVSTSDEQYFVLVRDDDAGIEMWSRYFTPEQAIAATVGRRTDLAKRLREVTGLHSFAELFGFSWEDGSDWTWHDVACAMADAVDAATAGAGTCHIEVHDNLDESEGMGDVWLECDKCHWQMPLEPTTPRFKHCPNCTRRVVSE